MLTPYHQLLQVFLGMPNNLNGAQVVCIIKKHLEGRRIHCSPQSRQHGKDLAVKLAQQGLSKPELIRVLEERLGCSRKWARGLACYAIDQRYKEHTHG